MIAARRDGEEFPVEVSAAAVQRGGQRHAVGIVRDITERKQAEQAIREYEERLRAVTASTNDAIIMVNDMGCVTLWNPAAERMFGYSADEVLGRELHRIAMPPRYRAVQERGFARFRLTGQGMSIGKIMDLVALRKNGEEFPIEISVFSFKVGNQWHAVGIVRDITDASRRRSCCGRAKRRLKQAEAIAHVGYWKRDLETGHGIWSDELCRICGLSPRQSTITISQWQNLIHPDDRQRVVLAFAEAEATMQALRRGIPHRAPGWRRAFH